MFSRFLTLAHAPRPTAHLCSNKALLLGLLMLTGILTPGTAQPVGTWIQQNQPFPMDARYSMPAVLDQAGRRLIIFSGARTNSFQNSNDIWQLDLTQSPPVWIPLAPAMFPPELIGSCATAFDPSRRRMLLFGGTVLGTYARSAETWALELSDTASTWTQITTDNSPPARSLAAGAFDIGRSQMIVFGGSPANGQTTDDTWIFNGNDWSEAETTTQPQSRSEAYMAYLPEVGKTLLFGGSATATGHASFNDTWLFNGTDWEAVSAATPPPPLSSGSLTPLPGGRVLLFGGIDTDGVSTSSVYLYNHFPQPNWQELNATGTAPAPRAFHAAGFDSANQNLVVFGGCVFPYFPGAPHDDTWYLGALTVPVHLSELKIE